MTCKEFYDGKSTKSISSHKGAGTTLWVYTGTGDPTQDPFSETGFIRLAKIKSLEPGEITAASEDDSYLDDPDGDWENTTQGEKSSGETSITLAWLPGEEGQKIWLSGLMKACRAFTKFRTRMARWIYLKAGLAP